MTGSVRGNLVAVVFAGAALAACDSTKPKAPGVALTLSSQAASIPQGTGTTVLVTLARTNFDKAVTLSANGVPAGVTASFTPSPVSGTSSSSTLQLSAGGAASPGTATITVTASGDGISDQSATLALTVSVTGDFSLGVIEPSVTVAAGGGALATLLVNRISNNAGNVSLTVAGAPSGMTATVGQSPTTQRSASVSVAASANVAPGTYTLTFTGTSPGLANQNTTLSVNVIAPGATANVTLPFCSNDVPVWFAYQNEGFPWQRVTASGASFTFAATAKVGIAYVHQSGAESETNVVYASRAELAAYTDRDCAGTKSFTGSVTGLTLPQVALMTMGGSAASVSVSSSNYSLTAVADRALDLIATRGTVVGGSFLTPDKMIVRRNLNLANQSVIPVLDFTAPEAFALTSNQLTISGITNETVEMQNTLWSNTSTFGLAHSATFIGTSATLYSMPAAQLTSGDLHELFVDTYQGNSPGGRSSVSYFASPADQAVTIGPMPNAPTITSLGSSPYPRLRARLVSQAEYGGQARFVFLQGSSPNRHFIVLRGTTGYYGTTPATWDLVVPDLSAVTGFNVSAWTFTSTQSLPYSVTVWSGRADLVFGAQPAAGDVVRFAYDVLNTPASAREALLLAPAGIAPHRIDPRRQYFRR